VFNNSPRSPKPRSYSGVSVVPILAEDKALFGRYPTTYPAVLANRISRPSPLRFERTQATDPLCAAADEWKTAVDKVNELWAPIVAENKALGEGGLLSYTLLAVPVHLHKNHKFRIRVEATMKVISAFLDEVRPP
jgi:hypothetical protein